MKLKHNKKRNTAVLYQVLIQELTKSILRKDKKRKDKVFNIIKEHFAKGTELYKDLKCYEEVVRALELDQTDYSQVLKEVFAQKNTINAKTLFNQQTRLVNAINKGLTKHTFGNFIPNYKNLATIYQIFGLKDSPSKRIVLENKLFEAKNPNEDDQGKEIVPIDNIVYKSFVRKFNEAYSAKLLPSQRSLLERYLTSLDANNLEFKIYLNEELNKIKEGLNGKHRNKIDEASLAKLNEAINNFREKEIDDNIVEKVLRIQQLFKELEK